MGIQLNIKSAEARDLAEQVATRSGETITQAVTESLRQRLAALQRQEAQQPDEFKRREAAAYAIIKGSRALWKPELLEQDYNDWLYDERGLPR